jgi:hypothetical protein
VVEFLPSKQGVAGSSPVSRSFGFRIRPIRRIFSSSDKLPEKQAVVNTYQVCMAQNAIT